MESKIDQNLNNVEKKNSKLQLGSEKFWLLWIPEGIGT